MATEKSVNVCIPVSISPLASIACEHQVLACLRHTNCVRRNMREIRAIAHCEASGTIWDSQIMSLHGVRCIRVFHRQAACSTGKQHVVATKVQQLVKSYPSGSAPAPELEFSSLIVACLPVS